MKEYCIYIRQGMGMPYILDTFKNFESAQMKLYDMICLEEERKRPYFVDNDFFNNQYNMQNTLKYFCIMVRDITEWEKYSNKVIINNCSNIIYFNNLKKSLTK